MAVKYVNMRRVYPDGTEAIPGFTLDVKDGEFMVFVGPSGCGKSTALRMTAGLQEITGGRLYIGDELVNGKSPQEPDIAMVFQDYAQYPHMTVAQNMGFALKMMKVPKDEIRMRVEKAAERLSLTALLDRKPKTMSGGQRQRVAWAGRSSGSPRSSSWASLVEPRCEAARADARRDRRPAAGTWASPRSTSPTTRWRP